MAVCVNKMVMNSVFSLNVLPHLSASPWSGFTVITCILCAAWNARITWLVMQKIAAL